MLESSKPHIFISYARRDRVYVRRLVNFLARSRVSVWLDDDIPTGDAWHGELYERLKSCEALLVVMSPAAAESEWVAKEVAIAKELGKRILPLLYAGEIILGLNEYQVEDVRGGSLPTPKLVDSIRGLAPGRRVLRAQVGIVPEAADSFQAREVAADIVEKLRLVESRSTAAATQILTGLVGMGKTQLAAQVARHLRDDGQLDLLVWVDARSRATLLASYARAGGVVVGADDQRPEPAATAFLQHLAATAEQWLVILDNADPAALTGWWPPRTPTGRTVVTSRHWDPLFAGHGQLTRVSGFTPEESRSYLGHRLAGQPGCLDGTDELAARLGGVPLALEHAATRIATTGTTCQEYAENLTSTAGEAAPPTLPPMVEAALALALDTADTIAGGEHARAVLAVLSMLNPEKVPLRVVESPSVMALLCRVARIDPETITTNQIVRDALNVLTRLNLVDLVSVPYPSVRISPLVQHIIRETTDRELLEEATRGAASAVQEWRAEGGKELEHLETFVANAASLIEHGFDWLWDGHSLPLLFGYGHALTRFELWSDAQEYFMSLAAESGQRLGPAHDVTMEAVLCGYEYQSAAGDSDGALAGLRTLTQWRAREFEATDATTLKIRWALARMLEDNSAFAEAAEMFTELARDYGSTLGEDDPRTLDTRFRIVHAHRELGDLDRAITTLAALVEDLTRLTGADHPRCVDARLTLAVYRGLAGDAGVAVAELTRLVAEAIQAHGTDAESTLIARAVLGQWQAASGDHQAALETYAAIYETCDAVLGPDHDVTLAVRAELANSRGAAGDPRQAAAELENFLNYVLAHEGPDTTRVMNARNNLANWYRAAGELALSAAVFEDLLDDTLRILGPDHPNTMATRVNLGNARSSAGDHAGAIETFRTLTDERIRLLGPEHADTLRARLTVAQLLASTDEPTAADAFAALLVDQEAALGPVHPDTLETRTYLLSFIAKDDLPRAIANGEDLVHDCQTNLGGNHELTWDAMDTLAGLRKDAGDLPGAVTGYRLLHSHCERFLGRIHPRTLSVLAVIADLLGDLDGAESAIAAYEELHDLQVEAVGPHHPKALATLASIEYWSGRGPTLNRHGAMADQLGADDLPPHEQERAGLRARFFELTEAGDEEEAQAAGQDYFRSLLNFTTVNHPMGIKFQARQAEEIGEGGDAVTAAATYREVVVGSSREFGPDDDQTFEVRSRLGHWEAEAGEWDAARGTYESLLADQIRVLGEDHEDGFYTRVALTVLWGKQGDAATCRDEHEKLYEWVRRTYGGGHEYATNIRANLAYWRGHSGDAQGAAEEYRDLLNEQRLSFGHNHIETLTTLLNLIKWLEEAHDFDGASVALQELIGHMTHLLGPDDSYVQELRDELDDVRRRTTGSVNPNASDST